MKTTLLRHYPRIGQMTLAIGDLDTPNGSISVVVDEGYTDEECADAHKRALRLLAIEVRRVADDLDKRGA